MKTPFLTFAKHVGILVIGSGFVGCQANKSTAASNTDSAEAVAKPGLSLTAYIDKIPGEETYNVICGHSPTARYFEANKSLSEMLLNRVCAKVPVAMASSFSILQPRLGYATLKGASSEDLSEFVSFENSDCQLSESNLGRHKYIIVNKIEPKHLTGDVLEVTFPEGAFPKLCDKLLDPKAKFNLSISELQGPGVLEAKGKATATTTGSTATVPTATAPTEVNKTEVKRSFFTAKFSTKFKGSEKDSTDPSNIFMCDLPNGAKIYFSDKAIVVNKHKKITLDDGPQEMGNDCPLTEGYLFSEHIN